MQEAGNSVSAKASLGITISKPPTSSSTQSDNSILKEHEGISFLQKLSKHLISFIQSFKKILCCFGTDAEKTENKPYTFSFTTKKISQKSSNDELLKFILDKKHQDSLAGKDSVESIIQYIKKNEKTLNISWTGVVDKDTPPLILKIFTLNHRIGIQLLQKEDTLKNLTQLEIQDLLSYLWDNSEKKYHVALVALIQYKNLFFGTKVKPNTENSTLLNLVIKLFPQDSNIRQVALLQIFSNLAAKNRLCQYTTAIGCSKQNTILALQNCLAVHFDPELGQLKIIPTVGDINHRDANNNAGITLYDKKVFDDCKTLLLSSKTVSAEEYFKNFNWRSLHYAFHPEIAQLAAQYTNSETCAYLKSRLVSGAWCCITEDMRNAKHIAIERDDSEVMKSLFSTADDIKADLCPETYLEYSINCFKKNSFGCLLEIRLKSNFDSKNIEPTKEKIQEAISKLIVEYKFLRSMIQKAHSNVLKHSDVLKTRKEMKSILESKYKEYETELMTVNNSIQSKNSFFRLSKTRISSLFTSDNRVVNRESDQNPEDNPVRKSRLSILKSFFVNGESINNVENNPVRKSRCSMLKSFCVNPESVQSEEANAARMSGSSELKSIVLNPESTPSGKLMLLA